MRFTTDKPVNEMSMHEVILNCCYISPERNVRYRDYSGDQDIRQMTAKLLEKYAGVSNDFKSELDFDAFIADNLQYGMENIVGMISTMYMFMCSIAELRERLKEYEDKGV